MASVQPYQEARRELHTLLSRWEQPLLRSLAQHMPAWVSSDHLTLLGFAALVGAGALYAVSRSHAPALLLVNLALLVNWFGDSLDGALARQRNRCRPRYGFYVDHIVDAFGALFLLGGLALSGYMSASLALGLLLGYYLISIHIYLAAHALGVFQISYAALGGTELRLLLALGNVLLFFVPSITLWDREVLLLDLAGGVLIAGLVIAAAAAAVRSTVQLYRLEPLPPNAPTARAPGRRDSPAPGQPPVTRQRMISPQRAWAISLRRPV